MRILSIIVVNFLLALSLTNTFAGNNCAPGLNCFTNGQITDADAINENFQTLNSKIGTGGGQGLQGKDGKDGAPGPAGPQGPKGDTGATGPAGPAGAQGLQGPAGPASTVAGPQGPKGDTGATGPQGPTGPASTVPGPQGPAGPKGDAGSTAAPFQVTAYNVYTADCPIAYPRVIGGGATCPTAGSSYSGGNATLYYSKPVIRASSGQTDSWKAGCHLYNFYNGVIQAGPPAEVTALCSK
jgi:hypothetical protein